MRRGAHPYTALSLTEFLGWDVHKIRRCLAALDAASSTRVDDLRSTLGGANVDTTLDCPKFTPDGGFAAGEGDGLEQEAWVARNG